MGSSQPFMYSPEKRNDWRIPATTFDPKAVTRASWEPKPRKPQQNGPLISFNRHPDAHMLIAPRANDYSRLGPRTKKWIKWLRNFQLLNRILQINGSIGILVLMVLITKVDAATGWVMRIAPGVAAAHCLYAIYHLSRRASGRTPGSSAAYHVFAGLSDLAALSVYAFGAFATHKSSDSWATRLKDQQLMQYFVPAVYYTLLGTGGLYFISLAISFWLAIMFRKISLMPPDMNPLEDHLTARPFHARNKSSITTASSLQDEKRFSTPFSVNNYSSIDLTNRPPSSSVPFMHTRTGSSHSNGSRVSNMNLPSRQYQIAPGNSSRSSVVSTSDKRLSKAPSSQLGMYRPVSASDRNIHSRNIIGHDTNQSRVGKFTETWIPTDSLISRTNQRIGNAGAVQAPGAKSYSRLDQSYNGDVSSDSEYEDENTSAYDTKKSNASLNVHPNPLQSHPTTETRYNHSGIDTHHSPWDSSALKEYSSLSELSANTRRVSDSQDITDQPNDVKTPWKKQRDSSIQLDDNFYSRPYGQLTCATPPLHIGGGRKVSSGVEIMSSYGGEVHERRNVSGKVAEEGKVASRAWR